jgi:hypothetical protein
MRLSIERGAAQGDGAGAIGGGAAQHHPDPRQRADRGRGRRGRIPRHRPRYRGRRPAPAKVEHAGATTVPAHLLHEIVRKLPDGALVELADDGLRAGCRSGRAVELCACDPAAEDFPVMATADYACNFVAPATLLRRLFDKSKFAISTEETRYYLNGVYMHVAEGDDGRACAAWPPTVTAWPGSTPICRPRRRRHARRDRAAQDGGRVAQAAGG